MDTTNNDTKAAMDAVASRTRPFLSACCNAPMRVEGRTTMFYVCEKCGKVPVHWVNVMPIPKSDPRNMPYIQPEITKPTWPKS